MAHVRLMCGGEEAAAGAGRDGAAAGEDGRVETGQATGLDGGPGGPATGCSMEEDEGEVSSTSSSPGSDREFMDINDSPDQVKRPAIRQRLQTSEVYEEPEEPEDESPITSGDFFLMYMRRRRRQAGGGGGSMRKSKCHEI